MVDGPEDKAKPGQPKDGVKQEDPQDFASLAGPIDQTTAAWMEAQRKAMTMVEDDTDFSFDPNDQDMEDDQPYDPELDDIEDGPGN